LQHAEKLKKTAHTVNSNSRSNPHVVTKKGMILNCAPNNKTGNNNNHDYKALQNNKELKTMRHRHTLYCPQ